MATPSRSELFSFSMINFSYSKGRSILMKHLILEKILQNLLLVDDEELLIENMRFLLAPHVSKVFTAKNGKEALAIFERETIHCVVSDLTMPMMNGLEFLKEVRLKNTFVPFIIYSAYINEETIKEISRFNVFQFLKKPDFLQIENTVLNALKGNL